eukprot:9478347-Pyramimonas_sp.AAC.1
MIDEGGGRGANGNSSAISPNCRDGAGDARGGNRGDGADAIGYAACERMTTHTTTTKTDMTNACVVRATVGQPPSSSTLRFATSNTTI